MSFNTFLNERFFRYPNKEMISKISKVKAKATAIFFSLPFIMFDVDSAKFLKNQGNLNPENETGKNRIFGYFDPKNVARICQVETSLFRG